jgi:hypothetical protein
VYFHFAVRLVTLQTGPSCSHVYKQHKTKTCMKLLTCDEKLMFTQKYLKCSQFSVGVVTGKEHTCTDVYVVSISCCFHSERGISMDV